MSTKTVVALVIGILFVPGIIMLVIRSRNAELPGPPPRQKSITVKQITAAKTTTRSSIARLKAEHPTLGEKGVLRIDGGSRVPICATQAVRDRLQQLSNVNDVAGIEQLIRLGSIRMVDSGTRVLVIGTDWTLFEVRILDGIRAGHSGFVERDFVWSR